jgi:hypothetical protein
MKSINRLYFEEQISISRICLSNDVSTRFFKPTKSLSDNHKRIMNLDLAIKGPDFIWEKILDRSQRKKIRRFERDGFQLREASNKSDFEAFLYSYYDNMKHIEVQRIQLYFLKFYGVFFTLNLSAFNC